MPYVPPPVIVPVIVHRSKTQEQPSTPPSPAEALANKALAFSAVAFMALMAAAMLASAIVLIRDEGWDWLSTLWLCAAVTMTVAVVALGVLAAVGAA
jgi:hypothetical protein